MINATFVFCDIVGFSRSDDDLQAQLICGLNAEVTHQLYHRLCEPDRSVIFLPTGDGLAIVLLEKDAARHFLKHDVINLVDRLMRFSLIMGGVKGLRIGVHRGPVSLIRDINGNLNVCGTAINDCQRIMDSAKANQVLFSSQAYRSLVGDSPEQDSLKFSDPVAIPVKHRLEVEVRIMFREGEPGWENTEPCPQGLLIGKKRRTQFIVKRLNELLHHPEKQIAIYEQSALSTFGIASQASNWPDDETDYVRLILDQKSKLRTLAGQERTMLKLVLRPIRRYSPVWMRVRCETLLEFLRSFRDSPNVDYVVVEDYEVPNRLVVKNGFSIEGYKMYDTSGYELSVIRTTTDEINEAIDAFEQVFNRQRSSQNKDDVITYFERLRDSCS